MKATEAKQLTILNTPKAIERNRKKSEQDIKQVYRQIKANAKKGLTELRWDYRDAHDRQHIKDTLEKDEFIVEIFYPYLIIKW